VKSDCSVEEMLEKSRCLSLGGSCHSLTAALVTPTGAVASAAVRVKTLIIATTTDTDTDTDAFRRTMSMSEWSE
jgi:hypothetical protein